MKNARTPAPWTQKALLVALVVTLGASAAMVYRGADYAFFDPLIDVKTIIDRYAVEKPDEAALQRAAIEGMLGVLDDPYAVYVPAAMNEDFEKSLTGEYVGIGAEVGVQDGYLHIVTPLDGSPAFRAGLMADDRVLEIDGQTTRDVPVDANIERLKGDPGTPVRLLVERDGQQLTIEITRDRITTPSVRGVARRGDEQATWNHVIDPVRRIAYLRLTQFTPTSAEALATSLAEAEGEAGGSLGGLVLDLRFNPGGALDQAIEMADLFLREGLIVSTRGRDDADRENLTASATPSPADRDYPVALLINGQSASASEVLAGALVENGRAVAIGTRSFGKGSVQTVRGLTGSASGAILKITEQRYYLPSGRSIQRQDDSADWGVDPSEGFHVPMTDEQTRDMLRVRREQEIIGGAGLDPEIWSDPEKILAELKDPQLAAAVEAVRLRIERGSWVPTGAEGATVDASLLEEIAGLKRVRERMLRELSRAEQRLETLETAVTDTEALAETEVDLLPDDAALEGGAIEVRDAQGRTVATLRITGPNLERWLLDAGVEPVAPDDAEPE